MADVSIKGDKAGGEAHDASFDPGKVQLLDPDRKFTVNGDPVILVGDLVMAHSDKSKQTVHPPGKVIEGSALFSLGGTPIARVGDKTTCGALLTGGDSKLDINS
ncbi:PAAR domain-containing protein [Pseudoalteromonas sp. DL2-H2.2]|uniref:PAAR domain-containing protein n=1 Tax=Pseudoalteromonas sp. DL2-H2.2 TaxID=2908889 RepID=UPI001F23B0F9|nr:PAAR domain-containing protein [Pseudoalteromonas sp. DL2-H2.2]MCF2910107.1 PAAR domain-containing protein [Pseudoalteromonas sp. DL2-H2.2]